MQIREIVIRNFRGIRQLTWRPVASLACLLGRGDIGKSSVLDAIELALSPRTPAFVDTDFFLGDTRNEIEILVTVGELSEEALDDARFGLHLRGWDKRGELRDEPESDDEPVVTVRLAVDSSLEGEWTLVTTRQDPKPLKARARALFGVVRLGPDVERHLAWGRYTPLSSATEDDTAMATLAHAFRVARDHIATSGLPSFAAVAAEVAAEAKRLGAYQTSTYGAALDIQRSAMSLAGVALHDGAIPVRLAGLGTRRLVSLAIQRRLVRTGAIVLIDEIEHGLEPHRIRHALKVLRDSVDRADATAGPSGQVFLTTHSPTTVVELSCRHLAVCTQDHDHISIRTPAGNLQALVRRVPEAMLSRRVLVCEGRTEIGLLRGLRDAWNVRRPFPFESLGTWLADGGGSQAPATALELASLGYGVALFRDSDCALDPAVRRKLVAAGAEIYEWAGGVATEQRIFQDVSWPIVQQLVDVAYQLVGQASVLDQIAASLGLPNLPSPRVGDWTLMRGEAEIRNGLGQAAHKRSWFKNTTFAEQLGAALAPELQARSGTSLAELLAKIEAWLHA